MIREAIILAGGLGTRLREAVPDVPKCMAPVAGRPFLFYVINYLRSQGIEKFIFSLGYKHDLIEEYLANSFTTLNYQVVIEKEPLGTGGAIYLACKSATEKKVIVTNGDTLFKVSMPVLFQSHQQHNASCTLALKPMENFDRYGVVELNDQSAVTHFKEKQFYKTGLINGGLYLLNVLDFLSLSFPDKFSFEKEYLELQASGLYGNIQDGYFIDIGIPEDFNRAQAELKQAPLQLNNIDKSWTLFLDRDGVINHEKKDDYILNWGEFEFYDGVKEAIAKFSGLFGKIIIVSNQRGVGKGLMTEGDLTHLHQQMVAEITAAGGRVDHIYYCTSMD
ncbi:MAG: HAD-IIIA family hydrolase, partial [Bacteroidetes bacterium]|nr:HAD-IIIA family hydrolase [Bacteroidota bacterium]